MDATICDKCGKIAYRSSGEIATRRFALMLDGGQTDTITLDLCQPCYDEKFKACLAVLNSKTDIPSYAALRNTDA